jgi:hypothetical protein
VGEIGCVATAPAIAGALHSYDGVRRFRMPMQDAKAAAPLQPKSRRGKAADASADSGRYYRRALTALMPSGRARRGVSTAHLPRVPENQLRGGSSDIIPRSAFTRTRKGMRAFDFYAARDSSDAVALLAKHGPSVKVLAGGTDLLADLKFASALTTHGWSWTSRGRRTFAASP